MLEQQLETVILHYHLFKNAGTSLDQAIKLNFPKDSELWKTKEFPANKSTNRAQLAQWIEETPKTICYSSHTAIFPTPKVTGKKILPIIFFRHPISRIVSAYEFEKKQQTPNFGAVVARNTNLAGYIEIRLAQKHDTQCRNFHAAKLITMYDDSSSDEELAMKALNELEFVGLVEQFSESLTKLESYLKSYGIDLQLKTVRSNVGTRTQKPLKESLAAIEQEIGSTLYKHLQTENALDIALWEKVRSSFS